MPAWLGDLPTWITCVAILVAAFQLRLDRERRQEEQKRSRREQARQLTAWTVTDPGTPRAYGIMLSNTSGSTFHDVTVRSTLHGETMPPMTLAILPPGEFFVRHDKDNRYSWDFAVAVEHCGHSELRPYMQSGKYRVDSVDFVDNADVAWHTDDHARLVERDHIPS